MKNIFQISQNCWKVENAKRSAVIIDGENYFRAVHESMRKAKRSIIIIGWDMHSELKLIRDDDNGGYPQKLGKFLDKLTKEKSSLSVYLLSWDFAMIYAMEREFFPRYKLKWRTNDRIHFNLDGEHPLGASQHQKIVVVDDTVAFAGGFDLSKWRWDTSEHEPENTLRRSPGGKSYPPFHDMQMVVDGDAAAAIGQLVKDRWKRSCKEYPIINKNIALNDPWPDSITPDFENINIAIARTFPSYKNYSEIKEVEQLYIDSISAAKKYIYIENQYLSSFKIGEALKAKLEQTNGPEIVIVLPYRVDGWLEQNTMGVLRTKIIRKLKSADKNNNLRMYYPQISANPKVDLMVHAKCMIIDDCFLRVGSSNLSNRSLGLDSECDLAISTESDSRESMEIRSIRNRLLSEHLNVEIDDIENSLKKTHSLIETIEELKHPGRTLLPNEELESKEIEEWIPDSKLLDPEKPIEPKELFHYFISSDQQKFAARHFVKVIVIILFSLGLAALWKWTPLGNWIDVDAAISAATWLEEQPLTPILVPLAYALGGIFSFPLTLMVIATMIIFGPWWGLLYALVGAELSAIIMFYAGRLMGKDSVRQYSGSLLNRVKNKLSESGLFAVITVRIIPIAPFSVVNLIAGVSGIRLRDFSLGTFIGLIPGIVAIAIVTDRLSESLSHLNFGSLVTFLGSIVLVISVLIAIRKWIRKKNDSNQKQVQSDI